MDFIKKNKVILIIAAVFIVFALFATFGDYTQIAATLND